MKPQISLNKQEKKLLEKGKTESLWIIIILVGASIFVKYLFYNTPNAQKMNQGWLVVVPVLVSIGLLTGIVYSIKNYLNYQLDIRVGQKISVSGVIEDKYSRRGKNQTYYFIVVKGQKYKLPDSMDEINYDINVPFVQKGDDVTIWFSPKTKTLFSVSTQNSPSFSDEETLE